MPHTTPHADRAEARRAEGLRDVTEAVRSLARSSRDVLADAGEVLEREIAMAVTVSEGVRDQTISPALLAEARAVRVQSGLRATAHRAVDLVADAVGVATVSVGRFAEAMVAEPRRAQPTEVLEDVTSAGG